MDRGIQQVKKEITFLDTQFFVPTGEQKEIPSEFECQICTGVILEPVECSGCQFLYCGPCIPNKDMDCPRRCGSKKFVNINKFVLRMLNSAKFKCTASPSCSHVTTYNELEAHSKTCEHVEKLKKMCKNSACREAFSKHAQEVQELRSLIMSYEDDKEQRDNMTAMLKSQMADQKDQFKEKINTLTNKVEDLKDELSRRTTPPKQVGLVDESRLKKLREENEDLKDTLKQTQSQIKAKEESIGPIQDLRYQGLQCPSGHYLKLVKLSGENRSISCDLCTDRNIVAKYNFHFHCRADCDYDVCVCCAFLIISNQKALIAQFKQKLSQSLEQQQLAGLVHLLLR